MNSKEFCRWLQGHFEISSNDYLTQEQVIVIKSKLASVLKTSFKSKKPVAKKDAEIITGNSTLVDSKPNNAHVISGMCTFRPDVCMPYDWKIGKR